jgi:hypothetical protein
MPEASNDPSAWCPDEVQAPYKRTARMPREGLHERGTNLTRTLHESVARAHFPGAPFVA